MPRAALASAFLAAAVALSGCGGGGGGDEDGGGEPPTPFEAWFEISERIAEEGSTPELALEAFALVFGPIPGAEPPQTSDGPGVRSGTGAIRLAMRHFDEFTPEQQRAISETVLPGGLPAEGDDSAERAGAAAVLASVGGARLVQEDEEEKFDPEDIETAEIDEALSAEARPIHLRLVGRLGLTLPSPSIVVAKVGPWSDTDAWEIAVSPDPSTPSGYRIFAEERVDTCFIGLTPSGRRLSGRDREALFTHEVFHCVQEQLLGPAAANDGPGWLIEGTAAWVGEASVGGTDYFGRGWWEQYLEQPLEERKELLARSYDAFGFWAQLDGALDGALWTALPAILRQPADDNSVAAFRAATAADPDFDTLWAPQHARRLDLLPELWWELDLHASLRAPAGLEAPVEEVDLASEVAEDGEWSDTVPARTPSVYELTFPQPHEVETETLTLEVKGNGGGAWVDLGRQESRRTRLHFDGDRKVEYCLDPGAECDPPAQPRPSRILMIGVVGLEGEAEIVVSGGESCEARDLADRPPPGPGAELEDGYETPEEAIRGCRVAENFGYERVWDGGPHDDPASYSGSPVYAGECPPKGTALPVSGCSTLEQDMGDRRIYFLHAPTECDPQQPWVLERGEAGWAVIEVPEASC